MASVPRRTIAAPRRAARRTDGHDDGTRSSMEIHDHVRERNGTVRGLEPVSTTRRTCAFGDGVDAGAEGEVIRADFGARAQRVRVRPRRKRAARLQRGAAGQVRRGPSTDALRVASQARRSLAKCTNTNRVHGRLLSGGGGGDSGGGNDGRNVQANSVGIFRALGWLL